ncbi:hypothetical protein HDU90_007158 [Geranomyces variabilis]|nr:hypothetical protein HDU90_007158 [Geranomyces variabilis]
MSDERGVGEVGDKRCDSWTGLLNPSHPSTPLAYFPNRSSSANLNFGSLLSLNSNNSFSTADVMPAEANRALKAAGKAGSSGNEKEKELAKVGASSESLKL